MPAPADLRTEFPEENFILAAVRGQGLPRGPVDVARLIRLADWHGVTPLVHRAVVAGESSHDETLRAALLRGARHVQRDNLLLLDRLGRLHDLLAGEGLECVLLKGGALIPMVYASADDRPMADIDLLVRAGDWSRLRAVLVEAGGYIWPGQQQEERRLNYFRKLEISTRETPASVFELHTALEITGRRSLSTSSCFQRAVPVDFLGRTFMRLCDEDMAFHLVIHAARHFSRPRLIWIHDLQLLAGAGLLDWSRLREAVVRTNSRVAAFFTLAYLEKVFPGTVPRVELEALDPGAVRRKIFAAYETPDPLLPTRDVWSPRHRWFFAVALLDEPVDMLKFLGAHLYRRFVLGSAAE